VLILSPSIGVRDYSSADSTQGIEIDEEKLLNMEDRLLQEEVAMARLNPSNDEVLKEFLNSIVMTVRWEWSIQIIDAIYIYPCV
jgi:hypothetical protein